jgi:23S rRNA U2552 (ribose-2'-O)-methylase RlmE/FtsJ
MFKKSPKNIFKPVLHTNGSSVSAGSAVTTDHDTHKHAYGPFLSYYNHFSLPQVGIIQHGTSAGPSPSPDDYNLLPIHIVHASQCDAGGEGKQDSVYVSSSVYSHLCDIKQQIEKYQDAWDNIKKFTNPYEYIHTNISGNKTNISKLRPLSRSFYKMIEIIKNNNILAQYSHHVVTRPDNKMAINTFHLAEGPGGFIEAISYLRGLEYIRAVKDEMNAGGGGAGGSGGGSGSGGSANDITPTVQILKRNTELHDEVMKDVERLKVSRRIFETQKVVCDAVVSGGSVGSGISYANDRYYGMTLINDDPICPGWKKTRIFLENHPNVIIETGSDKTGNLISIDNFMDCATKYRNKMEIITADGGFDFSVDFNNQENMATQLILCEVFYALAMQKQGGTFILKIFDVFHKATVDILYLLCYYYTNVSVMKPHTSRIANSEKYIVCQGFKIAHSGKIIEQISGLFSCLSSHESILSVLSQDHDLYFLNKIEEMNAMVSFQQIENITSTLSIITNHRNAEKLDQYKKTNVNKCIAWCEYYEIPYHVHHATIQSTNIFLHRSMTSGGIGVHMPMQAAPVVVAPAAACESAPL